MSEVEITPSSAPVPTIGFNVGIYGKFELPVLGQPGVPFGITNAFGVFRDALNSDSEAQKLSAWSMLIQTLNDTYPKAVRVLARLDKDTVNQVFTKWGEESNGYDPNPPSSQL